MSEPSSPPALGDYLTVGEAARRLGVSASTLRRWGRSGKLRSNRHPVNGYRLYREQDLESLLREAAGEPTGRGSARTTDGLTAGRAQSV